MMLDQLLNFIQQQKLFQSDEKLLLAVSGGIDSVVMLDLFSKCEFSFAVAHCNFKLRDSASDEDEAFVRKLAGKERCSVFVKSFDTREFSAKNKISIQMAARELRRTWFEELVKKEGFDKIATAHHLNDSLETVIYNLAKGTGIAGLQGILPKKDNYIRPMLFASREMIASYADQEGIVWREDQSNSTLKYSRNLIRHQVIPELKKINPNIEFTFAQSSEKLIGTNQLFQKVIGDQKSSLFETKDGHKVILKSRLKEVDEPVIILYEILKDFGFNFPQAKDIINSIDHQPGAVFLSDQYQLTLDRAYLFIEKAKEKSEDEQTIEQDLPGLNFGKNHFSFDVLEATDTSITGDRKVAMLDLEKLQFPLKIRYWQHGDAFYPLGMQHKKKVSDFMIDEKIPVNLKKQTMAIFSGGDLVWLVGWRIDDRFKITNRTKKIFRIKNNIQK